MCHQPGPDPVLVWLEAPVTIFKTYWNPTGLNTIHTSLVSAWARWRELCVHIRGQWMVQKISNSEQYLNWVIGGIFLLTAIIQLIKILRHKDAVDKLQHIRDEDVIPSPDHRAQGRSDQPSRSISLAHSSRSSGLNFQGAKLFSILLNMAFPFPAAHYCLP